MVVKTKVIYPEPGTRAAQVLHYIAENEGTTKNKIITALRMNPSVVKKCVQALMENERIVDEPDDQRHHHYRVRGNL